MTSISPKLKSDRRNLVGSWRTFWFHTEPAYTLGLIRIAFGVLVILWTLEILSQLYVWFGTKGIYPTTGQQFPRWSVFAWWSSDNAVLVGGVVLLISAIALAVGLQSRLAAILVFILVLSFENRDIYLFNAGDDLIRIEALFLALAPCGAALSLDQQRRSGSFWSAQTKEIWPIRLMQIQVTLIYLDSVIAKLRGQSWQDGTAVSYALRSTGYTTGVAPQWLANNAILMNAATWATLIIEFSIAFLVWNRRLCPWVIGAGVLLHLGIFITLRVAFFSPAIFVLYLAFLPPERAKAVADYLQKTLRRLPGIPAGDGSRSEEKKAGQDAEVDDEPKPTIETEQHSSAARRFP